VADSGAGDDASATGDAGGDDASEAGTPGDGGMVTNVRGQRYCEILLATIASGNVHVDVYNTFGLNDCPDAQWQMVDPVQVAKDQGVTQAILNGPRYWMLDAFVSASLVDPTPKTIGGIAMRHAGSIDMTLSEAMMLQMPYALHHIQRMTTVLFSAGKPVFELVDPQGKIYEMQSYSTQKVMQTQADLPNLASKLTLPSGWTWRTPVLAQDLTVTAVGGIGIVTQDDLDNTYQQSQQ
jgi:hypothetical protein